MHISRIRVKNWRNFRDAEVDGIAEVVYLLGPNASGKSNLLDALRFLRDVAKSKGGGLQEAVDSRGGLSKIRCLHARKDTEVLLEIDLSNELGQKVWSYALGFNLPGAGFDRAPQITSEEIWKFGSDVEPAQLLDRPTPADGQDELQLRQTHLEQINANREFRELALFLGSITYVHLVPQLLKFGDQIGGRVIESDPFGQEFMTRIAASQERTRTSRLRKIESALQMVVPHLQDLRFIKDEITGRPHLEMKFRHHRPHGARQREDQFSDGTLRLISLFWLLQEASDAPLLLEEPELSLNEEIVRQLPLLIERTRRNARNKSGSRQVLLTTHSYALLSNPGIDSAGLLIIEPSPDGSGVRKVAASEAAALEAGLSPAEVVLPTARKSGNPEQLSLVL